MSGLNDFVIQILTILYKYQGVNDLLKKDYFEMTVEPGETFLGYSYFLLKIYDLIETIFFVLRKKQRQVSFLHVYHHVMILSFTYLGMRSLPGKMLTIFFWVDETLIEFIQVVTTWSTDL